MITKLFVVIFKHIDVNICTSSTVLTSLDTGAETGRVAIEIQALELVDDQRLEGPAEHAHIGDPVRHDG